MRTMTLLLAASLAAAACLPACGENQGSGAPSAPSGATTAAASVAKSADSAGAASPTGAQTAATAAGSAEASVTPPASGAAAPSGAAAVPAASGSAAAGAKKFDCGAKGQKPCPMQGWMKSVMAAASSSGEGAKLAQALEYVAGHAPPGYGNWSTIANAGAAKAKAGDIDAAKASCKQCHDAYKDDYKAKMRDRPF